MTILATYLTLEKTFTMYVLESLARESGVWCLVAAPYIAVLIDINTIDLRFRVRPRCETSY